MDWKITIERSDNGYIVYYDEYDEEGKPYVRNRVIEDQTDELASHEALLYEVMDAFYFSGSKHDEERLRVIRRKHEDNNCKPVKDGYGSFSCPHCEEYLDIAKE